MKIIKDPIGFRGDLVRAVGAALHLLVTNIADHLKKGLVSWLLGTATKVRPRTPRTLRGIISGHHLDRLAAEPRSGHGGTLGQSAQRAKTMPPPDAVRVTRGWSDRHRFEPPQ
ncbi:hypothetical protein [Streptomyces sp. NPDC057418]|uniref:hypothetical protein n=1 Tax=unclassified Streptomyces TaxID=2593676 RepID=UPI0036B75106